MARGGKLSLAAAVAAVSAGVVVALPAGFSTFFTQGCPPGWEESPNAQGRLIVSVTNASTAGLTVGTALGDQEDRTHTHTFAGELTLESKNVAAIGCCNKDGAVNGNDNFTGITNNGTSGLPFTQLWFCVLQADDDSVVPFGGMGYYDPLLTACPASWIPYTAAEGRFVMPGYIVSGGEPVTSDDTPLASQEDRKHSHAYTATVQVPDVSFAGIDGCCNDSPAPSGDVPVTGTTDDDSAGIPYIQLLTCMSQTPTFNTTMPNGAVVFSPAVGCQNGWELANFVSGRFLVALPPGGQPGADFGAASLPASATGLTPEPHDFTATVDLPPTSIGLASGCCANGYAGAGTVEFSSTTAPAAAGLPFIMVSVCVQSPQRT